MGSMLCIDLTGDFQKYNGHMFWLVQCTHFFIFPTKRVKSTDWENYLLSRIFTLDWYLFSGDFTHVLPMIVVKLMRSKGMILDCPHIWDCSTYNIVEHQRTRKSEPISLFEDSLRFHYNLKHQEKLINRCWDVFMEYCGQKTCPFWTLGI